MRGVLRIDKPNLIRELGSFKMTEGGRTNSILKNGFEVAHNNDFSVLLDPKNADYIPNPSAMKLHNSPAHNVAFIAAMGMGKSYAVSRQLVNVMWHMPKSKIDGVRRCRFILCRKKYKTLISTTLKTFMEAFPSCLPFKFNYSEKTGYSSFVRPDDNSVVEAEFIFMPFDRQDSFDDLGSLEYTGIFLHEASELKEKLWVIGAGRSGRYPKVADIGQDKARAYNYVDSNAVPKDHWIYQHFLVRNKDNPLYETIIGPDQLSGEAENLHNLPGGRKYYTDKLTMPESYIDCYIRNKFVKYVNKKMVFNFFQENKHVIDEPATYKVPIYAAWDNSTNMACVLFQKKGKRFHIIDCYRVQDTPMQTGAEEICSYFAVKYPPINYDWEWGAHDPAFEGTGASQNKPHEGWRLKDLIEEPSKYYNVCKSLPAVTNSKDKRFNIVNEKLAHTDADGKPLLTIHKDCVNVIDAIKDYYYPEKKVNVEPGESAFSDNPAKNLSADICDAIQYGLLRQKEGSVFTIKENNLRFRHERQNEQEREYNENHNPYNAGDFIV